MVLSRQGGWLDPDLRFPTVSVVMGIPSVRREVHSYLTDTLHSLISELSPQEKEDSVIVVLIAEVSEAAH